MRFGNAFHGIWVSNKRNVYIFTHPIYEQWFVMPSTISPSRRTNEPPSNNGPHMENVKKEEANTKHDSSRISLVYIAFNKPSMRLCCIRVHLHL